MTTAIDEEMRRIAADFSGKWVLYAEHLATKEVIFYGDIHRSMETASVMKLPILLCVLQGCERGEYQLGEEIQYLAEDYVEGSGVLQNLTPGIRLPFKDVLMLMITVSDNLATNMVLRTIGVERVNQWCSEHGLSDTTIYRNISFDVPEPLAHSSVYDLVTMLKGLYYAEILQAAWRDVALDILGRQQYNTLLTREMPYALISDNEDAPPKVRVLSKSGSLTGVRNDAGLVLTPWGDYAIAIMSEGSQDPRFHVDTEAQVILPRVSRAVFDHYSGIRATS